MSLSAAEIALVVGELSPLWTGAFIQKIHLFGPHLALLSLRAPGRGGVLRLSVEPGAAHLCLVDERGPVDPEAGPFCMAARKWFKGSRLERLEQLGGDRVVRVGGPRGALVAEMLGQRGRLVLCDHTGRVVALSPPDALRPGLARGDLYAPPAAGGTRGSSGSRLTPGKANEAVAALHASAGSEGSVVEERPGRRRELRRALKGRIKRQRRLVGKVEADLERAEAGEALGSQGELLKANLHRMRRGMDSIEVADWYHQGEPLTIELDPSLSPTENLSKKFARARKGRRAAEVAGRRLTEVRGELERLEVGRELLDEAAEGDELEELAAELGLIRPDAGPSGGRRREPRRRPYRTFRDRQGRPIYVGKSAGDNDTLTVKIARPPDLWLHARGVKGSHVVVPLDKGEEVGTERLLDGATLAAHYSEERGNSPVEVIHTPRRYVQKRRGLGPGKVLLQQEKVLLLELEPERLRRLLADRDS